MVLDEGFWDGFEFTWGDPATTGAPPVRDEKWSTGLEEPVVGVVVLLGSSTRVFLPRVEEPLVVL